MILLRGSTKFNRINQPTVATIGNFDGFHLGHQEIINFVITKSVQQKAKSVLISFEPTPKEFFCGPQGPARIYPIRKKIELVRDFGCDYFACLHFNQLLATMPAVDFVKKILHDSLNIKTLVVGDDFKFGHHGCGNIDLLCNMGDKLGFHVHVINPVLHRHERVSSTLIREKLSQGKFDEVASLLSRPFKMSGRVFHGDKRARTFGFPTANILIGRLVSPIKGVFTVSASHNNNQWQGVANVGSRPTVNGQRQQLEVHLFNCQQDLYGKRLDVEFHTKLRDEIKFPSLEALKHQISIDVTKAQQYFSQRT
ncbi:MAG: bifunctional riboflavin kinase/FAD synthetase [Gammaproteobacteria bacterium]|nr:bifunctional riboflavin kinase/FAD synthetase [Gammaproteobacteria bacterium]